MARGLVPVLSGIMALLGCSDTPPGPSASGIAGSSSASGGAAGGPIQAGGSATAATSGAGGTGGTGGTGAGTSGSGSGSGSGGAVPEGGSAGQPNPADVAFCTTALDAAALQLAGFR